MTINCPKCGRELQMDASLRGHLLGCPFCQARFVAPNPFCEVGFSEKPCDDAVDDYLNDDSDYYYYDEDED